MVNKTHSDATTKSSGSSEYHREYYRKNKEACKARQLRYNASPKGINTRRESWLKKEYGISVEDYDALLLKQENKCAICDIHQMELKKSFDVDHCHKTNKVRGLLCNCCNQAIGLFKDSPENVKRAIEYLRRGNGK